MLVERPQEHALEAELQHRNGGGFVTGRVHVNLSVDTEEWTREE